MANAVMKIIRAEHAEAVGELQARLRVVSRCLPGGQLNLETHHAVAAWCSELNLNCDIMRFAVLTLHFTVGGDEPGVAIEADEDDGRRYYRFIWRAGESKRQFLGRAGAEFDRFKAIDAEHGSLVVSERIDPKHIRWFMRFQVNNEGYERIAVAEHVDRTDVKRAISAIAAALDLQLRPTKAGRPHGRGKARRPATLIVRSKIRR